MLTRLADHTTLRLGGPAREIVHARNETELVEAARIADLSETPLLFVAGGSNLVVSDAGFAGTVVLVETSGIVVAQDTLGGVVVTVAAGESWDGFVERAVQEGWVGVEALSGIPGSVGATPIQNVGAYRQEVADTIVSVRCWDRALRGQRTLFAADCGFDYRTSVFKRDRDRYLVLSVTFQFPLGSLSSPIRYAEVASRLGIEVGDRAPIKEVRDAVIGLRRGKGMVLDEADHDTWSAGSFFINPLVARDEDLPEGAPRWQQLDGSVKTSAAWLIEHAGFAKGYGNDRVALSGKHTLALTNRGTARTEDLLALAGEVQAGVRTSYGVRLAIEPTLVGCTLPERG